MSGATAFHRMPRRFILWEQRIRTLLTGDLMDKAGLHAPAVSINNRSDATSPTPRENRKSLGFERKSGLLKDLRDQFEKFKGKLDTGRASTRSSMRLSMASFDSIASNIRRASFGKPSPVRPRSSSATPNGTLPMSPDSETLRKIALHSRLETAIKTAPDSSFFYQLSSGQRRQLLSALDICTGLSDAQPANVGDLLALSDYLDGILKSKPAPTPDAKAAVNTTAGSKALPVLEDGLADEVKQLKVECDRRINELNMQTEAEPPQGTPDKLSAKLTTDTERPASAPAFKPDTPGEPGAAQQARASTHASLLDPAIADLDDLEQLEKAFSDAHGPAQEVITVGSSGLAIPEMDDMDQLAKELADETASLSQDSQIDGSKDELATPTRRAEGVIESTTEKSPGSASQSETPRRPKPLPRPLSRTMASQPSAQRVSPDLTSSATTRMSTRFSAPPTDPPPALPPGYGAKES